MELVQWLRVCVCGFSLLLWKLYEENCNSSTSVIMSKFPIRRRYIKTPSCRPISFSGIHFLLVLPFYHLTYHIAAPSISLPPFQSRLENPLPYSNEIYTSHPRRTFSLSRSPSVSVAFPPASLPNYPLILISCPIHHILDNYPLRLSSLLVSITFVPFLSLY